MMNKRPLVSVVDDEESVRESLPDLLKEFGSWRRRGNDGRFVASRPRE